MKRVLTWTGVVCLAIASACSPAGPTGADEQEGELYNTSGLQGQALFDAEGLAPQAFALRPFVRVGLRWDAAPGTLLEGRVMSEDGSWGPWTAVEAYWQEGVAHNGHLDAPAGLGQGFQLRLASGDVPRHVVAEGIERLGEPGATEAPPQPGEQPAEGAGLVSLEQALFPSSIVHPRSAWGAQSPRCSMSSHSPVKVTVHHTATPLPDSMTPPQRLRQIQAYHMYTNGWCDIGYHVLVDWNGAAWQGRNETKVGAHVANYNTGNVGLSYLGTYSSHSVSTALVNKGASILRWLHNHYGIPRSRTYIKGHRQYAATACPGDKLYAKLNLMVELSKQ